MIASDETNDNMSTFAILINRWAKPARCHNQTSSQKLITFLMLMSLLMIGGQTFTYAKTKSAGKKGSVTTTPAPATTPATSTTPIQEAQSIALRKQQDVAEYLQDTSNVEWLSIGQDESFLSLYRADQTGKALGLTLLLHGEAQHPAAEPFLETLRTGLPANGWSTMSIGLLNNSALLRAYNTPESSTTAPNASGANNINANNSNASNTNANSSATSKPQGGGGTNAQTIVPAFPAVPDLTSLQQNFQQRLSATLPKITAKSPAHLVVIAFDISALWLFEALQDGLDLPGLRAIIIIDAHQPKHYTQFDLTRASIEQPVALLDISVSHPDAQIQSQFRRIRAQQKQRQNYRHITHGNRLATPAERAHFLQRISAWLSQQIQPPTAFAE